MVEGKEKNVKAKGGTVRGLQDMAGSSNWASWVTKRRKEGWGNEDRKD